MVVAAAGIAVTALVLSAGALFLRPLDGDDGGAITVSGEDLDSPWCNDNGVVCVTRESLAEGFALYTPEPHPQFREKGCRAAWLPRFDLSNVGGSGYGAFRSPCSGATFDRRGHLLFGPSARDLDRYLADGEPGRFRVDTSRLQPGPGQ